MKTDASAQQTREVTGECATTCTNSNTRRDKPTLNMSATSCSVVVHCSPRNGCIVTTSHGGGVRGVDGRCDACYARRVSQARYNSQTLTRATRYGECYEKYKSELLAAETNMKNEGGQRMSDTGEHSRAVASPAHAATSPPPNAVRPSPAAPRRPPTRTPRQHRRLRYAPPVCCLPRRHAANTATPRRIYAPRMPARAAAATMPRVICSRAVMAQQLRAMR